MLARRTMQQSLRRVIARNGLVPRLVAPAVTTTQTRTAASTTITPSEGNSILAAQRLNRPVSPHLGIYQPQITWYLSILNRITGSVLSGGFYIFGFGYLVAPLFGLHLESHALVAGMASMSLAGKLALKTLVGSTFVFHSLNGVRHLVWDTGAALKNKAVNATGWAVVAATAAGTLALLAV